VVNLPEPQALRPAVGDEPVGARHERRLDFLLVRLVRPDRGDVRPRRDPRGAQDRLAARGGRDHDVGAAHRLFHAVRRAHGDALHRFLGLHPGSERLRAVLMATPDADLREIPDQGEAAHLVARLRPGAENRRDRGVPAAQVPGGDGAGESRPQVGDVAVVEQEGRRRAGARVERHHQPAAHGETALGVVRKAVRHLHGPERRAEKMTRLDVDLRLLFGDVELDDRRQVRLAVE
jgi:hypothetical protein